MAKRKQLMCVISFNEEHHDKGFSELLKLSKKNKTEFTCMKNDYYAIDEHTCSSMTTPRNHIMEKVTQ